MFTVMHEHLEDKAKNTEIECENFDSLFKVLPKMCERKGYVSIKTNNPAFIQSGRKEFIYTMDKSLNSYQKKECIYEWLIPYFQKNVDQKTSLKLAKYASKIKEENNK